MAIRWHIITPEYPPDLGGVSDYSAQVFAGLRGCGDSVHVWCHGRKATDGDEAEVASPWVHRSPSNRAVPILWWLSKELNRFEGERTLLVQWVPHGFGWKSMNVAFCLWLWWRANRGDRVELMAHEAYLGFGEGNLRQDLAALVHRVMTVIVLQAATRVWLSTSSWEKMFRPYALGRRLLFRSLPVPSNIPVFRNGNVGDLRCRFAPGGERIVGHFGTHGALITEMLERPVTELLRRRADVVFVFIGKGGCEYRERLLARHPELGARVFATGRVSEQALSCHILACDVLLQPYPDGVSTRRTTALAGLAHGTPIVTSEGKLTEAFWSGTGAVALVPTADPAGLALSVARILDDCCLREEMCERSVALYRERFDIGQTIEQLRGAKEEEACFASH